MKRELSKRKAKIAKKRAAGVKPTVSARTHKRHKSKALKRKWKHTPSSATLHTPRRQKRKSCRGTPIKHRSK